MDNELRNDGRERIKPTNAKRGLHHNNNNHRNDCNFFLEKKEEKREKEKKHDVCVVNHYISYVIVFVTDGYI